MVKTLTTFDEWVDLFKEWQEDIGLRHPVVQGYKFETKFGDLPTTEIQFGHFAGRRKWEKIREIPDQRIKDALLHLIVYQGDTEFASVEQQRRLFETAPTEYDLKTLARVMLEEMRHGWQMSHLLMEHFGHAGMLEARKLLERRSFQQDRLLGSFNIDVANWLDFFAYTQFIDRDGKFQLQMLSSSAFAPLARSMFPMLKEEAFHLGTGNSGLRRTIKAGKVPIDIIQRYFNKWIPTAFDLFGTDHSSSAHWFYLWGLKGRFDEGREKSPADMERLNEEARELYRQECEALIGRLNQGLRPDSPKLVCPDIRFNRSIGEHANRHYALDGTPLGREEYDSYLKSVLPSEGDERRLQAILREGAWIAPPGQEKPDESSGGS
ncbi:MAG: phenylacetate-CoA oxygenase subunit PaaI [Armatimonadetes bacterium]|nr:phenylacetate-CoA oxygenase subunit PaaI [Armatimonadota bacterium]